MFGIESIFSSVVKRVTNEWLVGFLDLISFKWFDYLFRVSFDEFMVFLLIYGYKWV